MISIWSAPTAMKWALKALSIAIISPLPWAEDVLYFLQKHVARTISRQISLERAAKHISGLQAQGFCVEDAVIVELGPGWIPVIPALFFLLGAKRIYLIDRYRHLKKENVLNVLHRLKDLLPQIALISRTSLDSIESRYHSATVTQEMGLDDMLAALSMQYVAPADTRHTGLPSESVDLITSTSVMQLMSREHIDCVMLESCRILKPHGWLSHLIIHRDPFVAFDGKGLRFSDKAWDFLVPARLWANRMREHEYLKYFEQRGFAIKKLDSTTFPKDYQLIASLKKARKLAPRFQNETIERLAVGESHFIAQKCT
jgi:hypothetical protein